jgi:hypothetical protein
MDTREKMVAEARLFVRLGLLSFLGFAYYYAQLFFGLSGNAFLFKALAIVFLISSVPLPIIAINNKKLFPELGGHGKQVLALGTVLILVHHFLMTFLFVMFLSEGRMG